MKYWKVASTVAALVLSTSANAALIERLGGLAYYDDVADLTWLADANFISTYTPPSPYNDGRTSWYNAHGWLANLSIDGVDGWRLPSTVQPDASCDSQDSRDSYGYNCTGSEMGNLYYNVLGNTTDNFRNRNTGPFSNIQTLYDYWSATEYAPYTGYAWTFNMGSGEQYSYNKGAEYHVWAVQSGDVSAVPVPAAVWLFGSGLIGLAGIARRKKA